MTRLMIFRLGQPCVWALVLGVLTPALRLHAREMSAKDITAAVETWVRKVPAKARPDAVIEKLEPYQADGKTAAYIAHLAKGGYCICGTDDELPPVYLYSPVSSYAPADPDLPFILRSIPEHRLRIEAARKEKSPKFQRYAPKLARRVVDWQSLIRGEAPLARMDLQDGPATPTMIALPANSFWHQGSPFNQACPALPTGSTTHCVVGCVGTATSQIMYYWKWPTTGIGEASVTYDYRSSATPSTWLAEPLTPDPLIPADWAPYDMLKWEPTNGGELKAKGYWDHNVYDCAWRIQKDDPVYHAALDNLWGMMSWQITQDYNAHPGVTTYQWGLMLDSYAGVPLDDPAAVAVRRLCADVAIAANMAFGLWGSTANGAGAAHAYVEHFRYDSDAVVTSRDTNLMIEEIQWLRPVQMSGGDGLGAGHSWMTCGYDTGPEPDLFLMNAGNGGGSTYWVAVDEFWPSGQQHVTRIAPAGVVRFVGNTVSGDGSPSSPFQDISAALSGVDDGTTLIFKAGTTNTFSTASLTISRPMTLKGCQVNIQRQ